MGGQYIIACLLWRIKATSGKWFDGESKLMSKDLQRNMINKLDYYIPWLGNCLFDLDLFKRFPNTGLEYQIAWRPVDLVYFRTYYKNILNEAERFKCFILIVMNTKLIQNIVNLYSTPKIIFLGISFKITEIKSGTHYMVTLFFFSQEVYEKILFIVGSLFCIITKKSSVKHMKLAKNGDV